MKDHLPNRSLRTGDSPKEEPMTFRRFMILIVLVSLVTSLAGCQLSASTPPPTSPTVDSAMGTLQAELGNIATQTAAAGGGATPQATQPPVSGTETSPASTAAATPQVTEPPQTAAPTSPPVVVPTPTPGLPTTYQLQKGEFPFCIARRFNLNVSELLSLNGLGLNTVVPVGYTLKIPQTGNKFSGERALKAHPTSYTVRSGDTIYSIACEFGDVDPNAIILANNLSKPYTLTAGTTIQIP
jgi:LysM repeat protein